MKTQYRIINVGKGLLRLQPANLNKVEQPYIEDLTSSLKTLNGISLIGAGENITIPVRLKEVVVQNKSQLLGTLLSDVLYLIDGSFSLLAGETIVVPAGGLNIMGYSFDASRIASYGLANHTIFTSAVGGSGNLIIHNIAFNATGTGAKVFDIFDSDGTHAVELVTVNFEGCKSIGKLRNYRQGTGITIGFYGCADGLMLSGTWTGFKLTNTNCFGFGATGTLFKKDVDTVFSNRLYLEINADFQTGSKLADFQASNFSLNELFQINSSILKYNGTINDDNATSVIPNIKANDVKCLWRSNVGLPDTALEKYIENSAVTGSYTINWLVDTYFLTLTGNTNFTESNLPASGKNTEELKIYLAGNFTPTFPAAWEVSKVGTFKKGEINQITLKFIKTGVYFMKIDNTLTVYPAPRLGSTFPNSLLPESTGPLRLKGSFFTPACIVKIQGQVVNTVTFDDETASLDLSVTTGVNEGDFDIEISNGTNVVYNKRLPVVLGTVFIPIKEDWSNITNNLNVEDPGEAKISVYNSLSNGSWNKPLNYTKNFSLRFSPKKSPLGVPLAEGYGGVNLKIVKYSSGVLVSNWHARENGPNNFQLRIADEVTVAVYASTLFADGIDIIAAQRQEYRCIGGILYYYIDNVLKYTFPSTINENLQLVVNAKTFDFVNIKYIELT